MISINHAAVTKALGASLTALHATQASLKAAAAAGYATPPGQPAAPAPAAPAPATGGAR